MIEHKRLPKGAGREYVPGVLLQAIGGERLMLVRTSCAAGVSVPAHRHEAEQLVLILEGSLVVTIAGEEIRCGPGDAFVIPSNAEHSAYAPDGAEYVEAFAPVRAELL